MQTTFQLFLLLSCASFVLLSLWFGILSVTQKNADYTQMVIHEYQKRKGQLRSQVEVYYSQQNVNVSEKEQIDTSIDTLCLLLDDMSNAKETGDWHSELAFAIEESEGEISLMERGVLEYSGSVYQSLALNRYLLQQDIPPKVPPNACDGLNTLVLCFQHQLFPFLLMLFPMLLSAFQFTAERQHGGFKLLLQAPASREKLTFIKAGVVMVQSAFCTVVSAIGPLLFCTAVAGPGDPRYPLAYTGGEGFLSTSGFLLRAIPLSICALACFTALGLLFGMCIGNGTVLPICSVAVPAVLLLLQTLVSPEILCFPLFSTNAYRIIFESSLPLALPCLAMLLLCALCLMAALALFRRKDLD